MKSLDPERLDQDAHTVLRMISHPRFGGINQINVVVEDVDPVTRWIVFLVDEAGHNAGHKMGRTVIDACRVMLEDLDRQELS